MSIWQPIPPGVLASERDALDASARTAAAAVESATAFADRLENDIVSPLAVALAAAAERYATLHAQLLEGWGDADERSRWHGLRSHVRAVHTDVVGPLAAHLTTSPPVAVLDTSYRDALVRVEEVLAGLPERQDLPVSDDLYEASGADGPGTAAGKALRRLGTGLRVAGWRLRGVGNGIVGRDTASMNRPVRHVDVPSVLRERLQAAFEPESVRMCGELSASLATVLRSTERALWTWTIDTLQVLGEYDRPVFHHPDDIQLEWRGDAAEPLPDEPPGASSLDLPDSLALPTRPTLEADRLGDSLDEDLRVAGTFLYRRPRVRVDRADGADRRAINTAVDRIRVCEALLRVCLATSDAEDVLARDIVDETFAPLERTYDAIEARLARVREAASALVATKANEQAPPADDDAADALEQLLLTGSRDVEAVFRDLPGLMSADRALTQTGIDTWQSLMAMIAELPESVRLRTIDANPRMVSINLADIAERAYERPLPARLAASADPLRRSVAHVWNEIEHVEQVMATTFHTAIERIRHPDGADAELDSPEDVDVLSIITDGLRRAGDALRERYQTLGPGWAELLTALHQVLSEDWRTFFRAVQSEDYLEQRVLGIRTDLARRAERTWQSTREGAASVMERIRVFGRAGRRRVMALVRFGRKAVGAAKTTTEQRYEAVDTLAGARHLYAELPLVYRRLFSLEPVSDKALATNRTDDLSSVGSLISRWTEGLGSGVIVVHGPLGSGRTTFLRLLGADLGDRMRTVRVSVNRRMSDEEDVASVLGSALYEGGFSGDLKVLERRIREQEPARGCVVLVDNLELLLRQAPGGADLVERTLRFLIRTDDRMCWCWASSSLAWQFAQATVSRSAGLAQTHALARWDAASIRDMVEKRHRRSGVSVSFDEPQDGSPLLRQRLRRARTEEAVQDILKDEFFDALYKTAGQNPSRGLFEWVRAGLFDAPQDALAIQPLRPLSFGYLSSVDVDVAFALRSFLFHNVLTTEDYASLFRTSPEAAVTIFETLLSDGLIESMDSAGADVIAPATRYRLKRLVLEPVTRSLRERHFVY